MGKTKTGNILLAVVHAYLVERGLVKTAAKLVNESDVDIAAIADRYLSLPELPKLYEAFTTVSYASYKLTVYLSTVLT
jgi:hypothetical protein